MSFWPESAHPIVVPSMVKPMSGRPKTNRRKETIETKKSGKLPKTGMAMICSLCHIRGHNKRGCPLKRSDGINIGSSTSIAHDQPAANPLISTRGRGRPKKTTTTEAEPAIKRGRGRPKKTAWAAKSENSTTRPRNIIRSADVIDDIGFKPSSGLKWKGTKTITTRRLQDIRDQARANGSNNASQSTTSSLPRDPWKLSC
ncbi:uncharacterized protein LOC132051071 [Lycium ferocissimum]|uniref:uncharacterized protein LOC132051071 n=1 Tax=Lycium ferocissimum TaxID=112874 RepID=UPI002814FD3F|nr:uncharacterized protein LOC132051071 [Lycium ferocissimum]